jgi:hypothetical protein
MTQLDDDLVPAVKLLIEELGKVLTFHVQQTSFDVATGTTVVNSAEEVSIRCAPPSDMEVAFAGRPARIAEGLVTYLPAQGLTFAPIFGMDVSFDGRARKITRVRPVYSGEQIAVYVLDLEA